MARSRVKRFAVDVVVAGLDERCALGTGAGACSNVCWCVVDVVADMVGGGMCSGSPGNAAGGSV